MLMTMVLSVLTLYNRINLIENNNNINNIFGIILTISITIPSSLVNYTATLWATHVSNDFTKRYERVVFCTALLDPKRDSFVGDMKSSYKVYV